MINVRIFFLIIALIWYIKLFKLTYNAAYVTRVHYNSTYARKPCQSFLSLKILRRFFQTAIMAEEFPQRWDTIQQTHSNNFYHRFFQFKLFYACVLFFLPLLVHTLPLWDRFHWLRYVSVSKRSVLENQHYFTYIDYLTKKSLPQLKERARRPRPAETGFIQPLALPRNKVIFFS